MSGKMKWRGQETTLDMLTAIVFINIDWIGTVADEASRSNKTRKRHHIADLV
jgi:hypothetical protein